MKKILLLFFATLLFTNSFFNIDRSIAAESFNAEVETKHHKQEISPTGLWFTEDEPIL